MKYTVLFSDDAEEDVAELLQYLVPVAGERIARRYVDRLIDYCYSFETFPERGVFSDKRPGLRLVGYRRKATVAFQIKGDVVFIVRIFHRGRNVDLDETEDFD
ncbi:plasmid stabilization system protein ParE [Neorhizobium sp. 2083]|uniref:type II toxin-antitoxin system RelE/ParE family toxin n=1 Tax=Neorhizobium sp. 2083 TaxID=2817762 RepID=UPI00285A5079|nr:type II toxin-antitoxin system RelE/ParE family toxin [Neorhizobium sp. 2083]MDR6815428.1 plasmid stabilization system protein ParE [Neorhizobium sp. 2083]